MPFAKDHPIQRSYEASDLYKHAKDLFDKKKFKEAKKSFQKVYDIKNYRDFFHGEESLDLEINNAFLISQRFKSADGAGGDCSALLLFLF